MRLGHKIVFGRLPGGTPRWFFAGPHRGIHRSITIVNVVVPGFGFVLWIEW